MEAQKRLTICPIAPKLLNLYGDGGNVTTLAHRLEWRGLGARLRPFSPGEKLSLSDADILFMGGGSDREQRLAADWLMQNADELRAFAQDGGVILGVCGGYQLLGHSYRIGSEVLPGVGILDAETAAGGRRMIGNVVADITLGACRCRAVGFENHSGITRLGDCEPLGRIECGCGNNDSDGTEGAVWNNVVGTYMHGPLLPKNPRIADELLARALERRYGGRPLLPPLDDSVENAANAYALRRFGPARRIG